MNRYILSALILAFLTTACGREPSRLLRPDQLAVYDFPLYLSDGDTVWKYESDRSRKALASGLNLPQGVATDRFNNLYVIEKGASRLLKFNTSTGISATIASDLKNPSAVAVDSFGEAYVTEDDTHAVIRAGDRSVTANFFSLPSAIVAGVQDLLIIADSSANRITWGKTAGAPSASVHVPVAVAIDGMGRVYAAEGEPENPSDGSRVLRYHQTEPGGAPAVIAKGLNAPLGIAVDSVGNVYVVEVGTAAIVLITQDGIKATWTSQLTSPQYIAFTQY